MATQGLSKLGWNMPTVTSAAGDPPSEPQDKDYDIDRTSTEAAYNKLADPEAGLPSSNIPINDPEVICPNDQAGVRKVEAVTLTWSKRSLRLIYAKYARP